MNASFSGVSRDTDQGDISLEPTVTGGELWIACAGTGVSTGGSAHSWYGPRSPTLFQENAWICARPTTYRGLASVFPDKKEKRMTEVENE